jgi:amino acid transporter
MAPIHTEKTGLKKNYLSFTDTIAQSFANIAPTVTPSLTIPLIVSSVGYGTWLTYLIITIGLVLVGLNISVFAQKFASSGALYTFVSKGLGSTSGFLTGWGLIAAYLFTAIATLIGLSIFGKLFFGHLGFSVPSAVFYVLGGLLIWSLAYRDMRLSSILALVLEIASVVLISIVGVIVFVKVGFRFDIAQFSLKGVTFGGIQTAMVLGVFSFVGFESAATLGGESRNPHRTIPRAVITSTVVVGLFFAMMSYVEVLGIPSLAKLSSSTAPIADLATAYGMKWFIPIIELGAAISFFSCSLASVNAAARVMYSMGSDGILHNSISTAHKRNQTPHVAVTIASIVNIGVPLTMLSVAEDITYAYTGTIATYGFLLAYILVSIGAPVYMAKIGQLSWKHIVTGIGGLVFMAIPLIGTFYPVPASPYNIFPYFFIGYLLLGWIYYAAISRFKRANTILIETGLNQVGGND